MQDNIEKVGFDGWCDLVHSWRFLEHGWLVLAFFWFWTSCF